MKKALLITAGGQSQRFGRNKLIEKVNGKEIILHTLEAFSHLEFTEIIITVSEELKLVLEKILTDKNIKLINGGKTRQASVFNGLKAITTTPDIVLIHDGARPLIDQQTIENCIKKAEETGAAIAAVPAIDTIKIVNKDGLILETPNRESLWCVQTPQVFDYKMILDAHEKLKNYSFTDDAGMLEHLNKPVYTVMSTYKNIKITHENDLILMQQFLSDN